MSSFRKNALFMLLFALPASASAQMSRPATPDAAQLWFMARGGAFHPAARLDDDHDLHWSKFDGAWLWGADLLVPLTNRVGLQFGFSTTQPKVISTDRTSGVSEWYPNKNRVTAATLMAKYAPTAARLGPAQPFISVGGGVKFYRFRADSGGDVVFPFADNQARPAVAGAAGLELPLWSWRLVFEAASTLSRFNRYPAAEWCGDCDSTDDLQKDITLTLGLALPLLRSR